jgi:hypothetical protein
MKWWSVACRCLQGDGRGLPESEDPGLRMRAIGNGLSKKLATPFPLPPIRTPLVSGGVIDTPHFSKAQPPIKQSIPHV